MTCGVCSKNSVRYWKVNENNFAIPVVDAFKLRCEEVTIDVSRKSE